MALTSISWFTLHLFSTSFSQHLFTKSANLEDHRVDKEGVISRILFFIYSLFPLQMHRTISILQPANGFLLSASSISVIPKDHTSLLTWVSPSSTSGAMYQEVPAILKGLLTRSSSSLTANPKSPSLTRPFSERSRFSGLMS